jgi:hypothetical protein
VLGQPTYFKTTFARPFGAGCDEFVLRDIPSVGPCVQELKREANYRLLLIGYICSWREQIA